MKPFIQWVGGKQRIVEEILQRLPADIASRDYFEPFLGGGALFWALADAPPERRPRSFTLSDVNQALITTWWWAAKAPEGLNTRFETAKGLDYYRIRENLNVVTQTAPTGMAMAAYFLLVNRLGFNGLWRVNGQGLCNVPKGTAANPKLPDLKPYAERLQGVEVLNRDFATVTQHHAGPETFFYFDPPYHDTFAGYAKGGFGFEEHHLLSLHCRRIDEVGGRFMLSNSDTPAVRDLYRGFRIEEVTAPMSVSRGKRTPRQELIVRNY